MEGELAKTIAAIVAGLTALIGSAGAGAKFILSRNDKNEAREREWQAQERAKLESQFTARIDGLEARLAANERELSETRTELTLYVRHVGVLEGMLKAHDLDVPKLERVHGR